MKKIIALSVLLGTAIAGALSPTASFAQTVNIISGTLNTINANPGYPTSLTTSTFLTTLGIVNVNSNGFNGTLTNTITAFGIDSAPITSSVVGTATSPFFGQNPGLSVLWADNSNFLVFTGTTDGTSPNGAFTNAPTTINADLPTVIGFQPTYAFRITGGSITFPAPPPPVVVVPPPVVVVPPPVTCTDCLIVRPDLLISNSTLLSLDSQEPEYRQEYKNDFSASSFAGGRILGLEDK